MDIQDIILSNEGSIARIIMNTPEKLNAFTQKMILQIKEKKYK